MSEMLELLGHDCTIAPDGKACLAKLHADPAGYDLILMDLHIPHRSGLATSQDIRDAPTDPPRDMPIIAVTADSAYHTPRAVAPYGINGVLPKPIALARLRETIQSFALAA